MGLAGTETASIGRRGRIGGGDDNQETGGGFGSVNNVNHKVEHDVGGDQDQDREEETIRGGREEETV